MKNNDYSIRPFAPPLTARSTDAAANGDEWDNRFSRSRGAPTIDLANATVFTMTISEMTVTPGRIAPRVGGGVSTTSAKGRQICLSIR